MDAASSKWLSIRLACFVRTSCLVVFALTLCLSHGVFAAEDAAFQSAAKQALLMDATSGAVLYQKNADDLVPPASMSKLMTLAVLFRALKAGEVKLEDQFLMSVNAWRKGGAPSRTSAMMVPVNTKVSVGELIQGVVVESGNDAAIAIAEGLAGSEIAFAKRMNEEAKRIGLVRSSFRNPTGLYNPEQLMTARELVELARHLITQYPEYYTYFSQREFQYRTHRFINRNRLLTTVDGADGLKTGHLSQSGSGVTGSAVQNGRRLIGIVHGLATNSERDEEARRLFEWGFKSLSEVKLFDAGEVVGKARVWGGSQFYVALAGQGDLTVVMPRGPSSQRLTAEIVYNGPLKAPIRKGDAVAMLKVTSSTSAVTQAQLYATEDVEEAGTMRKGLDSLAMLALRWMKL